MKKIIVRNNDESITIIFFNEKKYKDDPSNCKAIKPYLNKEWFVTDQLIGKSDIESHKQLYVEPNSIEIKKDLAWEKVLMPDQLIKRKHINHLQSLLDAELDKQSPDPVTVVKMQRQIQKEHAIPASAGNDSEYWLEKSIEGLARAPKQKPEVEAKLNAKLQELRGKNG
jgi:hypothetical protein